MHVENNWQVIGILGTYGQNRDAFDGKTFNDSLFGVHRSYSILFVMGCQFAQLVENAGVKKTRKHYRYG